MCKKKQMFAIVWPGGVKTGPCGVNSTSSGVACSRCKKTGAQTPDDTMRRLAAAELMLFSVATVVASAGPASAEHMCLSDPSNKDCADATVYYAEQAQRDDVTLLCKTLPYTTGCSLWRKCGEGEAVRFLPCMHNTCGASESRYHPALVPGAVGVLCTSAHSDMHTCAVGQVLFHGQSARPGVWRRGGGWRGKLQPLQKAL